MDLIEVTEGRTQFFVPLQDPGVPFPPGAAAVFFNRRMELNRDATVLLTSITRPYRYLDAMAATGVRGLRIANECGIPVTVNDRNKKAEELIRMNVCRSRLPIEVLAEDVNVLLSLRHFDAVDLDPFGTPAPFTDAGVRSANRFLFITATDTAPLCGAHMKAGIRRYFAFPLNTEYHSEVGLRILMGFVAREAAKYDKGIEPLFCFAREHYIRLHLGVLHGAMKADRSLGHLGFVFQCQGCPHRVEQSGLRACIIRCEYCGHEMAPIGPLWMGAISSPETIALMLQELPRMNLGTSSELERLLVLCGEELPFASFYDYHQLAKHLKVSPPQITFVLDQLKKRGFRASRTHYAGTGIKTDAPLADLYASIHTY
jgi:tRNA (guanine26-N2/guanine27-N2)-dimethyltransferase